MDPRKSSASIVEDYIQRIGRALVGVDPLAIQQAASRLVMAREVGAQVFVVGNGGSASTASHMATDLGVGSHKIGLGIRAVSLVDNSSVMTATANDISFDRIFAEQVTLFANPEDVLIAISASGNSPNILAAVQEAKRLHMTVIGLTGFDGGKLRDMADISIHVSTEPGDYGPVEDVHLAVNHAITEVIRAHAS